MYFDFDYWWRVVRHVYGLKHWSGRWRMLLRLLVVVPLSSCLHALFFLLDYLFFPRLWSQQVIAPVFIVGHARSGTTLMHRLMSADSGRFSDFLYWEMFFPSLLQKKIIRWLGGVDERYLNGAIHRRLKRWDDDTFGPYRHMHNMSLWNSEEDCFALQAAFVSQQWSLDVPMMDVVDFFHVDQMPTKRRRWLHHYKELVKRQLLLNGGDKIHLSKNPVMSGWVESLIETFPDARFVMMIRDPAECLPSLLKLVELTWQGKGWSEADYGPSLQILNGICYEHIHHARKVLAENPQTRQFEMDYQLLTGSPREAVHAVYEALGLEVTDSFDQWLLAQAERERTHLSRFEYSLGEYRIDPEALKLEFAELYAQYQWAEMTNRTPSA